jgi:hypothetical protein
MLTRLFLLLSFFAFLVPFVNGQSFYRLEYPLAGAATQDGFLIIYEDGSALLRSRPAVAGKNERSVSEFILEERYAKAKDGSPADDYIYYETTGLKKLMGGGPKPEPLKVWFKLNRATGFFEPWTITDAKTDDIPIDNDLTAQLLESDALKKNLVLNYFLEYEDIFKTLFASRVRGLTPAEKKIKLHLLIIANTNDKNIGPWICREWRRPSPTSPNTLGSGLGWTRLRGTYSAKKM